MDFGFDLHIGNRQSNIKWHVQRSADNPVDFVQTFESKQVVLVDMTVELEAATFANGVFQCVGHFHGGSLCLDYQDAN